MGRKLQLFLLFIKDDESLVVEEKIIKATETD
ncbi:hypothetical protein STA3757_12230 [Stanieria sp. NIES-3757]|nr:hypothetical protein STA3757_12230 [Stanieria sp. NIES-3757]